MFALHGDTNHAKMIIYATDDQLKLQILQLTIWDPVIGTHYYLE
jgi:hypothetical protein